MEVLGKVATSVLEGFSAVGTNFDTDDAKA
jgi:hypothetical protein